MVSDTSSVPWPTYVPGGPISELLKIVTVRECLRVSEFLPPAGIEETVAAVVDATEGRWFLNGDGSFDTARAAAAWLEAWKASPTPCAFFPVSEWLGFFEFAQEQIQAAGYGYPKESGSVEVFRGCQREHLFTGLSWTTDLPTAVWFAMRQRSRGLIGEVYRAVVPAEAVLADFRGSLDNERELVINPRKCGPILQLKLSLDDKDAFLHEWLVQARLFAAEMQLMGATMFGEPTIDAIPEPEGGWGPLEQSVDPHRPGYTPLSRTPGNLRWPRAEEVVFTSNGPEVHMEGHFYMCPEPEAHPE